MIPDFHTTAKIEEWRKKAREGTLTLDEAKQIVAHLRGNRSAAVATSKPSRSHVAKPQPISGDDLLKDFM